MIFIAKGIIPFSLLIIVLLMIMWDSCPWFGKNVVQFSCQSTALKAVINIPVCCNLTEILLESVINIEWTNKQKYIWFVTGQTILL